MPISEIGRGLYIWKEKSGITQTPVVGKVATEEKEEDEENQYDIISSFGMFWRRDKIDWVSTPKIFGMQQIGADPVDFHKQIGIYLLYDGREVIYVGRATDRPLGRCLCEHTFDRFSSRWDRFHGLDFFLFQKPGHSDRCPRLMMQSRSCQRLKPL